MALHDDFHYLAEVLVSVTWNCNLHCSYCFVHNHALSVGNGCMSPEMAVQVVDALDKGMTNIETICIHFYGGEPLSNLPAIQSMVRHAGTKRSGRFRFAVTTNGVISDPFVYELLDKGRFQVILSIDGPDYIHDECRRTACGAATHKQVLQFLEGLRTQTSCWIRASAVVRSGWGLMDAVSYLSSLPVDAIKAQAVRVQPNKPYALTDNERKNYLRELDAAGSLVIKDLKAGRIPKDDRFSSRVLQLLAGRKRDSFCGAGSTTFGITPDGAVLPCILISRDEVELGHIRDEPSVWLKKGRWWRESRCKNDKCSNCSVFSLCGGGCGAVMSVCGDDECEIIRKNCEVATSIYEHFRSKPEVLLVLAGIV